MRLHFASPYILDAVRPDEGPAQQRGSASLMSSRSTGSLAGVPASLAGTTGALSPQRLGQMQVQPDST